MTFPSRYALGAACFLFLGWVGATIEADRAGTLSQDVLDVDVCVIGGGAAGT